MNRVILERREEGDQGTFGVYVAPGGFHCFSGELPDRDNASNISRLPAGLYDVTWTWSPRFRRFMYLLLGTSPRAGIREHPANLMGDASKGYRAQLNGCIALGEKLGWIDRQKALLMSTPAVRRFESHMQRKPFVLEIRNVG